MPKEEWGVKRLCIKCKSRFYDLNMDPMTCPECGASFSLDEFLGNKVKAPKEPAPIKKEKEEVPKLLIHPFCYPREIIIA